MWGPREIMWKWKRAYLFIYICLDAEVAALVKHDVTQEVKRQVSTNDKKTWLWRSAILFWFKHYRINFYDKLCSQLDPKYLSIEKKTLQ